MSCEFVVHRAVDVSKATVIFEIRHPEHAIRTPWARRLPTRPLQREHMLECIGILRHGPKSHFQVDCLTTTFMPEKYTGLESPGCTRREPRLQQRNDNVGNRYSVLVHVVMCWIAYRNPPEPLPCAKPMWELTHGDADGLERTSLVRPYLVSRHHTVGVQCDC